MELPIWWPPKAGDKLRHFTLHGDAATGGVKRVAALIHVLSAVEHNGEWLVTCAEWFPSRKRWNYEVFNAMKAICGSIWPDGVEPPESVRKYL